MTGKNNIEVIFSPALLPFYDKLEDKIVVVVDVLRATSSICVAFAHGAERILPVATPKECAAYKEKGFICAAERDGKVVEGFDIGNSPFSYVGENISGKSIALTTTNGTHAIHLSKHAKTVVAGSFLNLKYLCDWLNAQNADVIVVCAGWKNKFNLEDTIFAGAVVSCLKDTHNAECDSAIAAEMIWNEARTDLQKFILRSSHAHRFQDLGITEDVNFCMQTNIYEVIPVLQGEYLVKMEARKAQSRAL